MMFYKILLVLFLSQSLFAVELEKLKKENVSLEELYQGKGVLWGFDFISNEKVILTHKKKGLFLLNLKTKETKELTSPEFKASGQGGMLDVLFHKDFVYVTYSKEVDDNLVTALAKGEFKNEQIENLKDIYISNAKGSGGQHFGSRLIIYKDSILMTVGERNERDLAQSLDSDHGKVLRLTLDGKPHPENTTSKKRKAIFSYGHRNPQGIVLVGDKIYVSEFGPRGGDELNLIEEGKNYGWPEITYGSEYWGPSIGEESKPGMEQPIHYWVPSISPSGLTYYSADLIPEFKNYFFLANLSSTHIRMLKLNNDKALIEKELLPDLQERFRHIRVSPSGELYFSTDSGKLYKIKSVK